MGTPAAWLSALFCGCAGPHPVAGRSTAASTKKRQRRGTPRAPNPVLDLRPHPQAPPPPPSPVGHRRSRATKARGAGRRAFTERTPCPHVPTRHHTSLLDSKRLGGSRPNGGVLHSARVQSRTGGPSPRPRRGGPAGSQGLGQSRSAPSLTHMCTYTRVYAYMYSLWVCLVGRNEPAVPSAAVRLGRLGSGGSARRRCRPAGPPEPNWPSRSAVAAVSFR